MICPGCNHPMSMARYVPNEFKKFECGRCVRRPPKQTPGYKGFLIMSPKVRIQHQESLGEWNSCA